MTPVLVVAVVVAQVLDVVTWMAMPRAAEVNPLAQGLHSSSAWLLKTALVGLVFAVDEVVRIAPPPKYSVVAVVGRQLAELVVVLAIAAGFLGAGSNLAVIAYVNAAETPRSAPEPAPIASDATGIEQGTQRPQLRRGSRRLDSIGTRRRTFRRGTASWYAAAGLVARGGPGAPARARPPLARPRRSRCRRRPRRHGPTHDRLVRLPDRPIRRALIDLGDEAFVRLAPLSAGLLPVEVFAVRRIRIQPPATDR
jgi:hypothetical protein